MRGNTITMQLAENVTAKSEPLYQYDYGQKLLFTGVTLPTVYEVHFGRSGSGTSITMIGGDNGVDIPDELLLPGGSVNVWIYLHNSEDDGETEFRGQIPVIRRAKPTHEEPTPVQQSEIEQAISALSVGVSEVESIAEGIPQTINEALQEAKDSGEFDGFSPVVTITEITGGHEVTITDAEGDHEFDVLDGHSPVVTASKSGKVTTVSVDGSPIATINDGTDGQDGEKGDTGATPALTIGTVETLEPSEDATVTITGTTDAPVLNFGIPQGEQGDATIDDTKGIGDTDFVWSADKDAKELDKKSPVITEEIGESVIAQFTDGADGMPMEMTVGIEPVQDLHGQESPYPPGGGKNKFDQNTIYGEIKNPDGTFTRSNATGQANPTLYLSDYIGQTITFSILCTAKSGETNVWYLQTFINGTNQGSNVNNRVLSTDTLPKRIYMTVTPETANDRIEIGYGSGTGTITFKDCQLEVNSSMTTYAPYSNICPISGWTGAEVARTRKNLFNGQTEAGAIAENGTEGGSAANFSHTKLIPVKAGDYTITENASTSHTLRVHAYDQYGNWKQQLLAETVFGVVSETVTIPSGIYYIKLSFRNDTTNIQVERGSATAYEAYAGQTYSITFPDPPGTVYGGTLTVNKDGTGTLVVDRACEVYDGSDDELWERHSSGSASAFAMKISLAHAFTSSNTNIISNYLTSISSSATWGNYDNWISSSSGGVLNTGIKSIVDIATWRTYLASNPLEVCYELATPVTYQLTASQVGQIKSLYGLNNVWANTGDVLELNYTADTKLYISKELDASRKLMELIITANREDEMKATKAYTTGNLLIVNGTLYKVTTSIANGATLTVGTNVTATTVAAEIAALS